MTVSAPPSDLFRAGERAPSCTPRPLRIGLCGLFLVPGGSTGGLEPYFHHLVGNLLRLDQESRYVLLATPWNVLEFAGLRGENLSQHVVRTLPTRLGVARHMAQRVAARVFGTAAPPPPQPPANGLAGLDLDFVHCFPAYIHPALWNVPSILTVADLQHEFYPEFFSPEELQARRVLFQPSAEHAVRVIAISEYTRQTIIDRFQIPAEKVSVIPLGASSRFFSVVPEQSVTRVRRKYRLPDAYCIYAANLWPHKNHRRLLHALASIPAPRRPHLVLTGSPTRTQTPIRAEIKEWDLEAHVSWLGFVDADDLPALLAGARFMVFPSLFEGFGMPVVEAMAAGCPVTCANATALPEVAGDAAYYFDPKDSDAIGAAIEQLWNDGALRLRLQAAGRARARQFTWRRTTLRTLQLYRETAAQLRARIAEEARA